MYESQAGSDAGMGIFPIIFFVAVYVYFAYTQARMADRIGMSKYAWWAYVPILYLFLLFRMASKPAWWFVLCLVPLVNISLRSYSLVVDPSSFRLAMDTPHICSCSNPRPVDSS